MYKQICIIYPGFETTGVWPTNFGYNIPIGFHLAFIYFPYRLFHAVL